MAINNNIENILDELSVRVDGGKINLKNEDHLNILIDILKENNWPKQAIVALIRNILLISEDSLVQNKKSKNIYPVKSYNSKTQKLIKKDALLKDIEKYTNINKREKNDSNKNIEITDKEKNLINKSISKIEDNIDNPKSIYKKQDDKKIVKNFIDDIKKLLNDPNNSKHAKNMVDKYNLSVNKDTPKNVPSKLYLGLFNTSAQRKLLGNTIVSSILSNILKDNGALGIHTKFVKKSMTPNKIFKEVDKLNINKSANGITINNIKLHKAKNYNYDNIKSLFVDKYKKSGLSDKEAEIKAENTKNEIKIRVDRHNFIIDNFEKIIGSKNSLNVLSICKDCNINTSDGQKNIKNKVSNAIQNKIIELSDGNLSDSLKDINKNLKELNNIEDVNEYDDKINSIIHKISNDKNTSVTSSDVIEIFDYLKLINKGIPAYLPSDANFKLGDVLKLSSKQPDIKTLLSSDNISSLFVSIEDRSVKKGVGGASATGGKIPLTKFKHPDTNKDLLSIIDNYKTLIHDKNTKDSDNIINKLENKYSNILKNDETYKKAMENKDDWIKRNNHKLHDINVWNRYYQLGNMLTSIYNNDVEYQGFQNSKYIINKKDVKHEISDGVTNLAKLKFEISVIKDGIPLNPYPSRFYNSNNYIFT